MEQLFSPLPYHLKVCQHFMNREKTWQFFKDGAHKTEQLEELKTQLLTNSYQYERGSAPELFSKIDIALEKLGIQDIEVQAYQMLNTADYNASVIFSDKICHLLFSGDIIKLCSADELQAVIGHELTHIKFFTTHFGQFEISDRIISAIANNFDSAGAYVETARLFKLYTEIFCDRGAYQVLGNIEPVITTLVKVSTGIKEIDYERYMQQVEEIFNLKVDLKSQQYTHPETYIRAKALLLWHTNGEAADGQIQEIVAGKRDLEHLDVFGQEDMEQFTTKIISLVLKPNWMKTTLTISLAKQYQSEASINSNLLLTTDIVEEIENSAESLKIYLSYLLYDFCKADIEIETEALGWIIQLGEDLGLKSQMLELVMKENKFSQKKAKQFIDKAMEAYTNIKEGEGDQIYE
jgi:hypothetical protein